MKRVIGRSERKRTIHAFFHPYASGEMTRRNAGAEANADLETGGGVLHPLDGHSPCTQAFRVRNDLRITQ